MKRRMFTILTGMIALAMPAAGIAADMVFLVCEPDIYVVREALSWGM